MTKIYKVIEQRFTENVPVGPPILTKLVQKAKSSEEHCSINVSNSSNEELIHSMNNIKN